MDKGGITPPPIHTDIYQYTPEDNERINKLEKQIKTISDTINSLIHTNSYQYIPVDNERLTYLEEQVGAISDKIESPIHTDTNQYEQVITDLWKRLEALEQERIVIPPTQPEVNPVPDIQEITQPSSVDEIPLHEVCNQSGDESIPGNRENEQPSPVVEMPVTTPGIPDNQDRIIITDEMRQALISQVDKLQAGGMSYRVIGDHIGIAKGRLSDLKSGKLKTLTLSQYETLMDL